uniref:Uncharacterized protein n=1 Tax=Thermosporothrix sp. COM3 TaxID=2490863 RepID=A0A455STP3_9CHLR|nr:hypothetical protein KTC_65440 [Thermosporothrix sp. COM3]
MPHISRADCFQNITCSLQYVLTTECVLVSTEERKEKFLLKKGWKVSVFGERLDHLVSQAERAP